MADSPVTQIGPGVLLVSVEGRRELVYVAGSPSDRWAFWNGHVFRSHGDAAPRGRLGPRSGDAQTIVSPMPATVIKVLVRPGDRVSKGQSLVVLEAMKMELPVRSLDESLVKEVYCREGELVKADQALVLLE